MVNKHTKHKIRLTRLQRTFLQRVRLEYPFSTIGDTIQKTLSDNYYNKLDQSMINNMIETWLQMKKKRE